MTAAASKPATLMPLRSPLPVRTFEMDVKVRSN